MLNPFVFTRFLAGHWSLLLSYALWPIAIKRFSDFLAAPGDRRLMAEVALLTGAAAVRSHGVFILLLAYALLYAFHLLKNGIARETFARTALLGVIVLIMNLYWIVPTIALFGDTYSLSSPDDYLQDFSPTYSRGMTLGVALATLHGFWRGGFAYTMDFLPFWPLVFLLIAAVVLTGFIHLLRERAFHAIFLLALALAGLLLALGDSSPISWVFTAFGKDFPLYMMFRDSQKFAGLICLAYAWLGSYGVHALQKKPVAQWALALVLALPVIYNFGFFGFLGQIGPTQYPADWQAADGIIAADNVQANVLILPPYLYDTYSWANASQKTLGSPAPHFFSKPSITEKKVLTPNVNEDIRDARADYIGFLFRNRQYINETAELLLPLNARYVVLFKDREDTDHYLWLFKRKGGVKNITLVYEGESLYLFRNDLASGPFFASQENGSGGPRGLLENAGKGVYSPDVSYRMTNPASYLVESSPHPYVVFGSQAGRFLHLGGQDAQSWHGIGNAFQFQGAGTLSNSLFPLILALFLLSWGIALALLLEPPLPALPVAGLAFAGLFLVISDGTLGTASTGALLAVSAGLSILVFKRDSLRELFKSFLNLE